MKTVGTITLGMIVAALYVFDVAGAREPMTSAYTTTRERLAQVVHDVREALPAAPRAG